MLQLGYITKLLGDNVKICSVIYFDYETDIDRVIIDSGFLSPEDSCKWWSNKRVMGGGSQEAAKTGFNKILNLADKDTLVFHMGDQPPHSHDTYSREGNKERAKVKYFDWVHLCKELHKKDITVHTLWEGRGVEGLRYYMAAGNVFNINPHTIDTFMVKVLCETFFGEQQDYGEVTVARFNKKPYPAVVNFESEKEFRDSIFNNARATHSAKVGKIPGLPDWSASKCDLVVFKEKFAQKDSEFRATVLNSIEEIVNGGHVMWFTESPLLGKVWRVVCANRNNEDVDKCINTVANSIAQIHNCRERAAMNEWLEESHDESDTINSDNEKCDRGSSFLVLNQFDSNKRPKRRDLLNICRGLGSFNDTKNIINLFAAIDVHSGPLPESDNSVPFISTTLHDGNFFRNLSHLISPGLRMNSRGAKIIAMMAYIGGNVHLKERAKDYLHRVRGKWINLEEPEKYPENYSPEFIRLCHLCSDFALTEEEQEIYQKMWTVHRLKLNMGKTFTLKVPAMFDSWDKTLVFCPQCQNSLPPSVMVEKHHCALCKFGFWHQEEVMMRGNWQNADKVVIRARECKSCSMQYATCRDVNFEQPKCHYCRWGEEVAVTECEDCHREFQDGAKTLLMNRKCNECILGTTKYDSITVTLKDIITKYSEDITKLFGVEFTPCLVTDMSLYKTLREVNYCEPITTVDRFYYGRKWVANFGELIEEIKKEVMSGSVLDMCPLCCSDVGVNQMTPSCGRCDNRLCPSCAKEWYGEPTRGKILLEPHTRCPFCKLKPRFNVVKKYNEPLARILGAIPEFDPKFYHAWCGGCDKVKIHSGKSCAGHGIPKVSQFRCSDCLVESAPTVVTKECPGCTVSVEKDGGCNHVYCNNCEVHWCWQCRDVFDESKVGSGEDGDIYEHLQEIHGGIY
jgi:hypothetical protein